MVSSCDARLFSWHSHLTSSCEDNPESGTCRDGYEQPVTLLLNGITNAAFYDGIHLDIAGANAAGWASVLVHTGVFRPEQGSPTHRPTCQATNVEEAVAWAIERANMRGVGE